MAPFTRPLRVVIREGDIANTLRSTVPESLELRVAPTLQEDDIAPLITDADVMITNTFTKEIARHARRLRLIQCTGAGTDWIDMHAVPASAAVCNADGHDGGVTEYVFMTMSALHRDLLGMDRRLRAGDWRDHRSKPQPELRGRTLAVLGLGRIGTAVARMAAAYQMRVTAVTNNPDPGRRDELRLAFLGSMNELADILPEADFVVVAMPLNESTRGFIGADEFRMMKSTAYLVNVARGPVVDEAALFEALRDRMIAGAAIDVWYRYPEGDELAQPSHFPFHELDNVLMTPHVAGLTEGTMRIRVEQYCENLRRLATGEALLNVVRPAQETI